MSSLSVQGRAIVDRYEETWKAYPGMPTPPPDLDSHIGVGAASERLDLFRALLRTDLEQRLRHGLMPSIRYYLKYFPEYGDEIRKTFESPFLMDRLGRGGMGEVYRAFDFVARRPMAVKMIRTPVGPEADTADTNALQRFYAEIRAVAALHHPNIVRTYDTGHVDGVPYLCLELVEGGSLSARVKEGPTEPRQAAALVAALARGVQHAHEHGIIHRDLKPANVLLAADGTPKVSDFGLAKLSDDSCGLTHTGAIMGTPEYMAPEQAEGRTKDIGPAADIWALGGILYALLTGRPAFRAEGRETLHDVLRKVCQAAPVPPRTLTSDLPTDLEVICLKCLEKRPADRYDSAQELAEDLCRFVSNEPIQARPIGLPGRLRRWALKNKAATIAAGAVLMIVLLMPATVLFAALVWMLSGAVGLEKRKVVQEGEAKVRAEIRALQDRADVLLSEARETADTRQALTRIGEAVALREQVQEHLDRLSSPTPEYVADQHSLWQERWIGLRDEATRRLTRTELRQVRSVSLPGPANDEARLGGAVSPDGSWFVYGYSWDHKLHLVRRDTGDSRTLTFPRALPKSDLPFGGPGGPGLAVSPGGGQIAILYPMAEQLATIAPNGDGFRTFPLPAELGRTSSFLGDNVRFPEEDRIEAAGLGRTWSLRLSEAKWSLPPAGINPRRPPDGMGRLTRKSIQSGDYFVNHDPTTGQVLASVDGGPPRLLWRDTTTRVGNADGERCLDLCAGTAPPQVYLLTTKRLLLVDAATGTRAEIELGPDGNTQYRQTLFPSRGGVALLRQNRNDRVEVTFLAGTLAAVPIRALAHAAPVRALDLASDGLLATAADRQVHLWQGEQLVRSHGGGGSESGPNGLPNHPALRHAHPWWGFLSGPRGRLVIEYQESSLGAAFPGGNLGVPRQDPFVGLGAAVRTEVYDSEDGRLLHTFPATGTGRIVRGGIHTPQSLGVSPDRRFAMVVAAENRGTAELELWSLEECRSLARLGRRPLASVLGGASLDVTFSPQGRWLILAAQSDGLGAVGQKATVEVTFWRLPDGKRTGQVAFPFRADALGQIDCHFDRDERSVLLTASSRGAFGQRDPFGGGATAMGSPAWVIDLAGGKLRCTLDEFETRGAGQPLHFADDSILVPGGASFSTLPNLANPLEVTLRPCILWSLTTGQRFELGEPWENPPAVEVSPDGRRALLHGHIKAGGGLQGGIVQSKADVQLWDLAERKLLKKDALVVGSRPWDRVRLGQKNTLDPAVAGDRENVYLAQPPGDRGEQREAVTWRWSDGESVRVPARTLLAADADEGWLLWGQAGKLFLTDRVASTTVELEDAAGVNPSVRLSPDRQTAFLTGRLQPGAADRSGFWEVRTGKLITRPSAEHEFPGFDASGRWAVTRKGGRDIVLLDLHGGPSRRLELPLDADRDLAQGVGGQEHRSVVQVRADGDRLAVAVDGKIHLWNVTTNQPLGQTQTGGHSGSVHALTQHAGKELVASAGKDQILHLWDRRGQRPVKQMIGHTAPITALAFRPDGEAVASASEDGAVVLWRTDGATAWSHRPGLVKCLAFPAHGRFLAAGTADGRVLLLDPETGATRFEQRTDGSEVKVLAFSRGGEALASGTSKGQVGVWSSGERDNLASLRQWDTGKPVTAVAWLPTRNVLLTGGDAVQFWELRSSGPPPRVWELGVPRPPLRALAVSESGRELFAADGGGEVVRFDLGELSSRLRQWNLEVPGLLGRVLE